jgi:hypothetical protein
MPLTPRAILKSLPGQATLQKPDTANVANICHTSYSNSQSLCLREACAQDPMPGRAAPALSGFFRGDVRHTFDEGPDEPAGCGCL